MKTYVLSALADRDIQNILEFSVERWGESRAERYLKGLSQAFENLAEFPGMGRDFSHLRAGYFRFQHDSHAVFYRKTESGIIIVRVLHVRQQPQTYL